MSPGKVIVITRSSYRRVSQTGTWFGRAAVGADGIGSAASGLGRERGRRELDEFSQIGIESGGDQPSGHQDEDQSQDKLCAIATFYRFSP
jgi:hypothetical protein